jgi:hypothetical protein
MATLVASSTARARPEIALPLYTTRLHADEIVPGERFDRVTRFTSRADLTTLYAPSQLEDVLARTGDEYTPGTRIHQGERSFTVVWSDPEGSHPTRVQDIGPGWRIEQIGLGTTWAELKRVLGSQFEIYGFGWDFGGTVSLERSTLARYADTLWLRVRPTVFHDDYRRVLGDQLYPAPAFDNLAPAISWFAITFYPPGR